jgi:hypothetical protein
MIQNHHEGRRKLLKKEKKTHIAHSSIVCNAGLEEKNKYDDLPVRIKKKTQSA